KVTNMAEQETTRAPRDATKAVERLLQSTNRGRLLRWLWLVLLAGGGVAFYMWWSQEPPAPEYITETVDRGDIVTSVTTTGSLEPRRTIVVGAEVSGRVATVEVQENDRISQGQVLARFDTELLEASVKQAEASLAVAHASVTRARATRDET